MYLPCKSNVYENIKSRLCTNLLIMGQMRWCSGVGTAAILGRSCVAASGQRVLQSYAALAQL